jgi:TrmH family RNA methyltransferase
MIEITSPKNPKIKQIKSLYRRKVRWDMGLFIVEGIKIVEECIDNNYPLDNIIYSDELLNTNGGGEIYRKIKSHNNLIYVPNKLFKEISDTENPQGIMAIAKITKRSIEELYKLKNPLVLFLEEVQDPGNMGTIIRTADAFNIDGIIISEGSVDIYNPKVIRSTMGSIFRMPIYYIENNIETIEGLKNMGFKIFATSLEGKDYIYNIDFKNSSLILMGNESKGLSTELNILANKRIKIPILGGAESLNVAIASSIIMYEGIKQRMG